MVQVSERDLLAKQVKGLDVLAREKVSSFLEGNRRSLFRGSGTEFADLRAYVPGDETKHIDWRATARRQDTLIVREYELERNTNVVLLLDASASMLLGKKKKRIILAIEAIASLTHAAIQNRDLIGFGAFSDKLDLFIPPKGGKLHQFFIYRKLLQLIPSGRTKIGDALKGISASLKRRSLLIVVSDLHDNIEETIAGFRIARAFNHELLLLQITDYGEYVLPQNIGKIKFKHPRTGKPEVVDFSNPVTKGMYHYHIHKSLDNLVDFKRNLRGLRVRVVECRTEDLVEKILLAYFSQKARKKIQ